MSNRGLVVPVDGRRMISTGVGIALVLAGAIVRFAVPATFPYGLNAHVVSVINAGRRIRPAVVAAGLGALGEDSPASVSGLRYRGLVWSCVQRYRCGSEPAEDLMQVGYIGLVAAINNFDPAAGCSLATYARSHINGEIRRHFRDKRWQLHVVRPVKELVMQARAASRRFYSCASTVA